MGSLLGLDYSSGRPRGAEVKRLGYGFVIRYCGQPANPKNATRAEVDDMLANGVAVALVFESTAGRASQGFNAGVADARAATAHQAALGIPASRPIYYAVDYDADPVAVEPYFQGVNAVPGPDGDYGSFRVVQRLRADGLAVRSWQTVAWSRGQVDPGRDLFQRLGYVTVDGVQCDVNEAFTADFGQHPIQENDMNLDDVVGHTYDDPDKSYTVREFVTGIHQHAKEADRKAQALAAQVAALAGALSDDEANIIAAFRAVPAGAPVDAVALAAALGPVLAPLISAGATPAQVEDAVRRVFASAGQAGGKA